MLGSSGVASRSSARALDGDRHHGIARGIRAVGVPLATPAALLKEDLDRVVVRRALVVPTTFLRPRIDLRMLGGSAEASPN